MTQKCLKEILSFREIGGMLRFQCKLNTPYMGNYQLSPF